MRFYKTNQQKSTTIVWVYEFIWNKTKGWSQIAWIEHLSRSGSISVSFTCLMPSSYKC